MERDGGCSAPSAGGSSSSGSSTSGSTSSSTSNVSPPFPSPASSASSRRFFFVDKSSDPHRPDWGRLASGTPSPLSSRKTQRPKLFEAAVHVKFEPPVHDEYRRTYRASASLDPTRDICESLLRRVEHGARELITRGETTALDGRPDHGGGPTRAPRYHVAFSIFRGGLLWAETGFDSFQADPPTSELARQIILATDRIVGAFLHRHDAGFRWTTGPVREYFTPRPETHPPCLGRPQPLSCIPRLRFIESKQSFEFVPGYEVVLEFKSRAAGQRTAARWDRKLVARSAQASPLTLRLGETLVSRLGRILDEMIDRRSALFDDIHARSCDGLEGPGGCQHFDDEAVELSLRVRNNLGPDYDHLSRRVHTKQILFWAEDGGDCLEAVGQLDAALRTLTGSTDACVAGLPDFTLRVAELRAATWAATGTPLIFTLDSTVSYSHRTIEAILDRVQTGIRDVLRASTVNICLVAHKKGHLILDETIRAPGHAKDESESTEACIIDRLRRRVHADMVMVCQDTCSLSETLPDTLPNLHIHDRDGNEIGVDGCCLVVRGEEDGPAKPVAERIEVEEDGIREHEESAIPAEHDPVLMRDSIREHEEPVLPAEQADVVGKEEDTCEDEESTMPAERVRVITAEDDDLGELEDSTMALDKVEAVVVVVEEEGLVRGHEDSAVSAEQDDVAAESCLCEHEESSIVSAGQVEVVVADDGLGDGTSMMPAEQIEAAVVDDGDSLDGHEDLIMSAEQVEVAVVVGEGVVCAHKDSIMAVAQFEVAEADSSLGEDGNLSMAAVSVEAVVVQNDGLGELGDWVMPTEDAEGVVMIGGGLGEHDGSVMAATDEVPDLPQSGLQRSAEEDQLSLPAISEAGKMTSTPSSPSSAPSLVYCESITPRSPSRRSSLAIISPLTLPGPVVAADHHDYHDRHQTEGLHEEESLIAPGQSDDDALASFGLADDALVISTAAKGTEDEAAAISTQMALIVRKTESWPFGLGLSFPFPPSIPLSRQPSQEFTQRQAAREPGTTDPAAAAAAALVRPGSSSGGGAISSPTLALIAAAAVSARPSTPSLHGKRSLGWLCQGSGQMGLAGRMSGVGLSAYRPVIVRREQTTY